MYFLKNLLNKTQQLINDIIPNININLFLLIYSLICTCFYSFGFWMDFFSLNTSFVEVFKIGISIILAGLFLYYTFFGLFSFDLYLLKLVLILFTIFNSVFSYYILTYNIYIDTSMMENVFNTDSKEISNLLSIKMFLYIIVTGIFC